MVRIAVKMMPLASSGQYPIDGLRIDRDTKLIAYAAMKTMMAIFHLGGATTVFRSGTANHVSRPVVVS
jgi:hypothetical protein